jgi:serine/threonine protein phosphatase PrpC
MAYNVELQFALKTDTGQLRSHNEDAMTLSPAYGFAVLADGMGGYNAGEVASGIATAVIKEKVEQQLQQIHWPQCTYSTKQFQQMLADAIEHANTRVWQAAQADEQYAGMGTTAIAVFFHHDKLVVAHVGDSRLYLLRQGALTQLTRDHSHLQELVDAGLVDPEEARLSPYRNLITRAVGIEEHIKVDVQEYQTQAGDMYLVCSDGLSDMLAEQEINDILRQPETTLDGLCDTLVQQANDHGGHDNISVILARIQSTQPETDGLFGRMFAWIK